LPDSSGPFREKQREIHPVKKAVKVSILIGPRYGSQAPSHRETISGIPDGDGGLLKKKKNHDDIHRATLHNNRFQLTAMEAAELANLRIQQSYTKERKIGEGTYASVFEGHQKKSNRKVAIKKIKVRLLLPVTLWRVICFRWRCQEN
jgi:serine/threonine protein kinase